MTQLPITRMTLYKHGVAFFERRATVRGEEVALSFRVEEMNDILKSLTVIDLSGGQVLGIDYATPQTRSERLAGCSIDLKDNRSLWDLLVCSRGRRVELSLDQGETLTGQLLGLDDRAEYSTSASTLVSLLTDASAAVRTVALERLQGVEILDERGAADLQFFLQTVLTQDEYSSVTVRMSPGEHDLSVSYVAPAPTWRVSYRLVLDPDAEEGAKALLLGWGIFDNRLEEDLQGISLSLVAGMPISFVYNLYSPFVPERPYVEEEGSVVAAPVEFGGVHSMASLDEDLIHPRMTRESLAGAQAVMTEGAMLGELFQYDIQTPVTVGRGQSAMVPVMSADLPYQKDLIYNGEKVATHPVATVRMKNGSGLTLERGPVTVLDTGEYVGEAVLPFTAESGEIVVPYAVELRAKVSESNGSSREIHRVFVKDHYLHFEEWDVRWRVYQLSNKSANPITVLVEHPHLLEYDLFDTTPPKERTDDHLRFEVQAPPWGEASLKVQKRRLLQRRDELLGYSHEALQHYVTQGLLDPKVYNEVHKLLMLHQTVVDHESDLQKIKEDREKIYQAQRHARANMQALSHTGKEGELRARFVAQIEETEVQLRQLEEGEAELKTAIKKVKDQIEAFLKALM